MRDEDQTHMHPANLFPQPSLSGWGNTTQYTLANSNLQYIIPLLVSFTWFLRVNNIEKMCKRDVKYEIT